METKTNPIIEPLTHTANLILAASQKQQEPNSIPNLSGFLDAYALIQNDQIISQLSQAAESEKFNPLYTTPLVRAMAIADRARARFGRATSPFSATDQPERVEARNFLKAELEHGERPAKEIISSARTLGLSHRTLCRAKSELKVDSIQRLAQPGNTDSRAWFWRLPPSESSPEGSGCQDTTTLNGNVAT